jgi:hypothetical protein
VADEPMSDCPDDEVQPCGCLLRFAVVDGVRTMTVSPCRLGCPNLASALALADEMGKNVEFRRAR